MVKRANLSRSLRAKRNHRSCKNRKKWMKLLFSPFGNNEKWLRRFFLTRGRAHYMRRRQSSWRDSLSRWIQLQRTFFLAILVKSLKGKVQIIMILKHRCPTKTQIYTRKLRGLTSANKQRRYRSPIPIQASKAVIPSKVSTNSRNPKKSSRKSTTHRW